MSAAGRDGLALVAVLARVGVLALCLAVVAVVILYTFKFRIKSGKTIYAVYLEIGESRRLSP
ncbi:hypothetical protein M3O75_30570 (plasmid) [Klebsiella pneumoniae]|uniref:Uncharacterized protein n=1 Tax=Klebsiella pneumoniae TaxID=573 RepID=A0A809T3W5_KLEPN|nr:hypothetical protein [Klebsiella pneumoniae]BBV25809.1 hypothetical protein [Klebsiella pneumoniae]BBV27140.1 hypothetical protein [Klebsiella pneumoniae]BDV14103.1 hypothetical protein [Escherichia coli]